MKSNSVHEDLIDLGAASAETQGVMGGLDDQEGGRKPSAGLTDD
jgi:hypothetical protein